MAQSDGEAMKEVMDGIIAVAEKERAKSKDYKDLFETDDVEALLSKVDREMTNVILNACQVLRQKHGYKDVPNGAYFMLQSLPLAQTMVTKRIVAEEGSSMSVDKARYIIAKTFKQLLDGDVDNEKS